MQSIKLNDIIDFNPTVKLEKNDSYSFIPMENLTPEVKFVSDVEKKEWQGQSSSKFENGDILFARIYPCLDNRKIAIAKTDGKGFGSTEFFVLRAKEGVADQSFVYYLSTSDLIVQTAMNSYVGASGRQRADLKFIKSSAFDIPSYDKQRKIAAILSTYDDLIDLNRKQIVLLENMLGELFKEWFVRFRFPDWENEKFVKGMPSEWAFSELDEVVEIVKGKSYTSEEIHDEKIEDSIYFINLKSFHKYGGYRDSGLKYYTGRYSEAQKVSQGDIVMAVTDMTQDRAIVGRVARIPTLNDEFAIISLDTVKIISKVYSENFMYCYLRYSSFSETVKEFANGANVLHLSPKQVLKQKVLLPPIELSKVFNTTASPMLDKIEALTEMNAQLELIKQQLLPRLMSSELSVDKLDIQYPPSMQTSDEAEEK
ncbi:restriction endonuclease subunit S [Psychrobacter glacincola]|uniref:restriction endonuclease subunit S n=1 Tax=Psychrobacter glacincola TaxID=56810 RepID=UPI003FD6688D